MPSCSGARRVRLDDGRLAAALPVHAGDASAARIACWKILKELMRSAESDGWSSQNEDNTWSAALTRGDCLSR